MPPDENVLRTIADELVEVVKKNKKLSVEEAAKKLKVSVASVQALVDFLVEEKIFGIEYKFTTPYIYIYKEFKEPKGRERSLTDDLVTKEQFYERAKARKLPYENIEGLWRKYLQQNLVNIRQEFISKARDKKVPEEKIEELWNRYLSYL